MVRCMLVSGLLLTIAALAAPAAAQPVTLAGYSVDPEYGWMPEKPITLGGFEGSEEERAAALFELLLERDGRPMAWRFVVRCCPTVNAQGEYGEKTTDLYFVQTPNGRWRRLFVNMTVDAPPQIPTSLTGHRSAEDRTDFERADRLSGDERLIALEGIAQEGNIIARRQLIREESEAHAAGVNVKAMLQEGMKAYEPDAFTRLAVHEFDRNPAISKDAPAVGTLRFAANLGMRSARQLLGMYLLTDEGGSRQPGEGLMWLRLAAEQGSALAQEVYGRALFLGRYGVEIDLVRGMMFLQLAAEQGDADAQAEVKKMMDAIREIDPNGTALTRFEADVDAAIEDWWTSLIPTEPIYLTRIAALQGSPEAMDDLALRLYRGITVGPDDEDAYFFARLAEEHGYAVQFPAEFYAQDVGLTPAQRAAVEARVEAWEPLFYR